MCYCLSMCIVVCSIVFTILLPYIPRFPRPLEPVEIGLEIDTAGMIAHKCEQWELSSFWSIISIPLKYCNTSQLS
jgi:hypothetical protein